MSTAHQKIAQADKKLQGGFMSMFTGISYDDSIDLYEQAANSLKLEKDFQGCANVYLYKLCPIAEKAGVSRYQQAKWYEEAGKNLGKVDVGQMGRPIQRAVELYGGDGKYSTAGKLLKSLAESIENDNLHANLTPESKKMILDCYRQACSMFELDDYGKSNFTACRIKLAEYLVYGGPQGAINEISMNGGGPSLSGNNNSSDLPQDYKNNLKEAIDIFETEGRKGLQNSLTKYKTVDYFWQAGILQLTRLDAITAKNAHERYTNEDPRWEKSQEGVCYNKLCEALEEESGDLLSKALADYNDIKTLDDWSVSHLRYVQEYLKGLEETNKGGKVDLEKHKVQDVPVDGSGNANGGGNNDVDDLC